MSPKNKKNVYEVTLKDKDVELEVNVVAADINEAIKKIEEVYSSTNSKSVVVGVMLVCTIDVE